MLCKPNSTPNFVHLVGSCRIPVTRALPNLLQPCTRRQCCCVIRDRRLRCSRARSSMSRRTLKLRTWLLRVCCMSARSAGRHLDGLYDMPPLHFSAMSHLATCHRLPTATLAKLVLQKDLIAILGTTLFLYSSSISAADESQTRKATKLQQRKNRSLPKKRTPKTFNFGFRV